MGEIRHKYVKPPAASRTGCLPTFFGRRFGERQWPAVDVAPSSGSGKSGRAIVKRLPFRAADRGHGRGDGGTDGGHHTSRDGGAWRCKQGDGRALRGHAGNRPQTGAPAGAPSAVCPMAQAAEAGLLWRDDLPAAGKSLLWSKRLRRISGRCPTSMTPCHRTQG